MQWKFKIPATSTAGNSTLLERLRASQSKRSSSASLTPRKSSTRAEERTSLHGSRDRYHQVSAHSCPCHRHQRSLEGLAVFEQRHPKEESDFPSTLEHILFVKANSSVQRLSGVESNCPASRLAEFVFRSFKEASAHGLILAIPGGLPCREGALRHPPNDLSASCLSWSTSVYDCRIHIHVHTRADSGCRHFAKWHFNGKARIRPTHAEPSTSLRARHG